MRGGGGGEGARPLNVNQKNLRGIFLHQNTLFKPLGEKHTGKKFFLDHPCVQCMGIYFVCCFHFF